MRRSETRSAGRLQPNTHCARQARAQSPTGDDFDGATAPADGRIESASEKAADDAGGIGFSDEDEDEDSLRSEQGFHDPRDDAQEETQPATQEELADASPAARNDLSAAFKDVSDTAAKKKDILLASGSMPSRSQSPAISRPSPLPATQKQKQQRPTPLTNTLLNQIQAASAASGASKLFMCAYCGFDLEDAAINAVEFRV